MKKFRITIENKVYDVLVELLDDGNRSPPSPAPTAARPLETAAMSFGAPPPSVPQAAIALAPEVVPAAGSGDAVTSPLAGKVVSIDVKAGQMVEEGSQVATIEAMKMNTYIFAPKAGKVVSIHANSGDGVEEGAVLLRLA